MTMRIIFLDRIESVSLPLYYWIHFPQHNWNGIYIIIFNLTEEQNHQYIHSQTNEKRVESE